MSSIQFPNPMPPIPALRGFDNLNEWRNALLLTLSVHGFAQYLLMDEEEDKYDPPAYGSDHRKIPKSDEGKSYCFLAIINSTVHVRERLVAAGYDFDNMLEKVPTVIDNKVTKDPKKLYDHVVKTISQEGTAIPELLHDFNTVSLGSTRNQTAYVAYVEHLRHRLEQLGCPILEKTAVWTVVSNIKDYDAKLYERLVDSMPLTWVGLLHLIGSAGNEEFQAMAGGADPENEMDDVSNA